MRTNNTLRKRKRALAYGRNEEKAENRRDPWEGIAPLRETLPGSVHVDPTSGQSAPTQNEQKQQKSADGSKIGRGDEEQQQQQQKTVEHPLHIGQARPDEPKVDQPMGAKLGIVPELSFRLILSGPSNSGKTNAARWVMDRYYNSAFDRLILMSPTAKIDPVWKDLKNLKKKDRISKLSLRPLKKLLKEQQVKIKSGGKKKAPKVLVIFDDTIGNHRFINSPEFLQCFIRGRHFNVSIIAMTQSYVKLPRSVRLQGTHIMFFPSFRSEIERLYDDHGPYQLNKKEWYTMVMRACKKSEDEQWPFFYIDTTKPVEERYRRCLYETIAVDPNREAPEEQQRRKGKKQKLDNESQVLQEGGPPFKES